MLNDARQSLVAALSGLDAPVYDAWPSPLRPPVLCVVPSRSGDYVTRAVTRGHYDIALDVVVVVPIIDRASEESGLSELVESVLSSDMGLWVFGGVSGTTLMNFGDVSYPTQSIRYKKQVRLS